MTLPSLNSGACLSRTLFRDLKGFRWGGMRNSKGSPMSWESSSADTLSRKFKSLERSASPCAVQIRGFLVSSRSRTVGSQLALKGLDPRPVEIDRKRED